MQLQRNVIDRIVIYTWVLVVLGTTILTDATAARMSLVLSGLLILQLGVWRVLTALLGRRRRNDALRDQVEQFLKLVGEMHRADKAKEASAFETVADKLRARTEGVIDAARTDLAR